MSDEKDISNETNNGNGIPQAEIVVGRHSSAYLIWILPLIALLVGLWLIYKSYSEAGVEMKLYLHNGEGIVPGETTVRFSGTTIGVVSEITVANDLKGTMATVEIDKFASVILQPDTVFWVVEPRITISQISGLETLVSGKFITFQLGEQTSRLGIEEIRRLPPKKFEYFALEEPPIKPQYYGGLHLRLTAPHVGSISTGAPVLFNKFTVGSVEKINLVEDHSVVFDIYIDSNYKNLVKPNSKFWNVSGVTLDAGLDGVNLHMDSLTSLLIGGISFSSPGDTSTEPPVENNHSFPLYESKDSAFKEETIIKISFNDGDGLKPGTAVKYNGIQIGEVTEVHLQNKLEGVDVTVSLTTSAKDIARQHSQFWVVKPALGLAATRNLDTLVAGKYITVKPGSGNRAYNFQGLDEAPTVETIREGLDIVLTAKQLGSIKPGIKIYYRNYPVGEVEGVALAENAQQVLIYSRIEADYAPLIHKNTRFWQASGVGIDFGLFSGAKIRTQSLENLLEGGIAFATPNNDEMGSRVEDGEYFNLYDEADEEWLEWAPEIRLSAEN